VISLISATNMRNAFEILVGKPEELEK